MELTTEDTEVIHRGQRAKGKGFRFEVFDLRNET
jgi:hypothetical protein